MRFQPSVIALTLLVAFPVLGGAQVDSTRLKGLFVTYPAFHSKHLNSARDIRIWLPPGYDQDVRRRYPVLYLHDGQNIYKGGPSFIPNQAWDADTTALRLIQSGEIPPLILVGIDNTGRDRLNEYTPSANAKFPGSGNGKLYGKMLVEELKPFVDAHYRTSRDASNTGLGGSSLGGLISLYVGLNYPKSFGKLAVVSPSVWWDDEFITHQVEKLTARPKLKVWVDIGTKEGEGAVKPARNLRATLLTKGWKEGADLRYYEAEGAEHNEKAWSQRFPEILKFLFGNKGDRDEH